MKLVMNVVPLEVIVRLDTRVYPKVSGLSR